MRWNVCLTGGADHESNFYACGRVVRADRPYFCFRCTTKPSKSRATYRDKTNSEGVMDAETFKTRVFELHAYVLTNLSLVGCERLIYGNTPLRRL